MAQAQETGKVSTAILWEVEAEALGVLAGADDVDPLTLMRNAMELRVHELPLHSEHRPLAVLDAAELADDPVKVLTVAVDEAADVLENEAAWWHAPQVSDNLLHHTSPPIGGALVQTSVAEWLTREASCEQVRWPIG